MLYKGIYRIETESIGNEDRFSITRIFPTSFLVKETHDGSFVLALSSHDAYKLIDALIEANRLDVFKILGIRGIPYNHEKQSDNFEF